MKICLLASGSSGNCIFIASEDTKILIDAGIEVSRIAAGLKSLGVKAEDIDALLITHEHNDHAREAGAFAMAFGCPIYANERTFAAMRFRLSGHEKIQLFKNNESFWLKELLIHPFPVFHDAADPCGFIIQENSLFSEKKVGIAIDLGVVTPEVLEKLKQCELVILESNHDLEMLLNGPYDWQLKQRIRSEVGHLSNEAAAKALAQLAQYGRLRKAVLAHLSQNNNCPELALKTAKKYLHNSDNLKILLAYRDRISPMVEI